MLKRGATPILCAAVHAITIRVYSTRHSILCRPGSGAAAATAEAVADDENHMHIWTERRQVAMLTVDGNQKSRVGMRRR